MIESKNAMLHVTAKGGVVTLTGTVPSEPVRGVARSVATETMGVSLVIDQLTIRAVAQQQINA